MRHFVPTKNVEVDRKGQVRPRPELSPASFNTIFELSGDEVRNIGSATIITRAFNACRTSWHLVLDIDEQRNLSVWLMLRGSPLEEADERPVINEKTPCFSSVAIDFEV